jgi:hypothetical protein
LLDVFDSQETRASVLNRVITVKTFFIIAFSRFWRKFWVRPDEPVCLMSHSEQGMCQRTAHALEGTVL